jgi:HEAT repeat protein
MLQIATLLVGALMLQTPSLDSQSPKERTDAIDQMAKPGNRDAIAPLAALLKKESRSDVRAEAVAGLARIGHPDAVPVLADTLRTDLDKDVRLQAIDSIQRLYIPVEDTGPIRTIFSKVKSVFSEPDRPLVSDPGVVDPRAKEALAAALQKDFNDEVRAAAARALGSLKAKDQVSALIATLESPQNREHETVRLEVVRSLGLIRDPVAGPSLEKALRDPSIEIEEEAILSLGLVSYKEARPVIENMFRTDRNRDVKRRAIEALALMRDPATIPLFESLLSSQDDYYREMAAEGLARLNYGASKLKERYDQEKKPNVKNALAFAMAASNQNDYINDLANALDTRQDYQAEAYLYELGKFEGKLPELHRYLRSSNPRVRARMARVVGNIGDPSSREPIQALTQDDNVEVLREATTALRKLSAR